MSFPLIVENPRDFGRSYLRGDAYSDMMSTVWVNGAHPLVPSLSLAGPGPGPHCKPSEPSTPDSAEPPSPLHPLDP